MNSTVTSTRAKKQAAPAATPSFESLVSLFLAKTEARLDALIRCRIDDPDWAEKDVDVDLAVDMARTNIQQLRANPPAQLTDFQLEYWRCTAGLRLAQKMFSRPDTWYGRMLQGTNMVVSVAQEMIEEASYGASA